MSDLKIVDGDVAGNFNPTAGLTRGAAAKIICNLILGPTTAAELNADTNPYPDVDKDSTFAGYIAYCQKEGIVGGYADGTFKPAAPLTGYAFMKMLLGALGYDAAVEGYVGSNWSIQVAKRALNIELDKAIHLRDFILMGELIAYDALHREESCGGHFREEHQTEEGEAKRDDENFFYVGCWEYQNNDESAPELIKEPLQYEIIKVQQRNYKN
jgi:hypothetical protein